MSARIRIDYPDGPDAFLELSGLEINPKSYVGASDKKEMTMRYIGTMVKMFQVANDQYLPNPDKNLADYIAEKLNFVSVVDYDKVDFDPNVIY